MKNSRFGQWWFLMGLPMCPRFESERRGQRSATIFAKSWESWDCGALEIKFHEVSRYKMSSLATSDVSASLHACPGLCSRTFIYYDVWSRRFHVPSSVLCPVSCVSCFLSPVSLVSSVLCRVSGVLLLVSCVRCPVSCVLRPVSCSLYPVSCVLYAKMVSTRSCMINYVSCIRYSWSPQT